MQKTILKLIAGMLLLTILAVFPTGNVAKADILKTPKLDIVSDGGVTIGPEYTFVPKITSASKIETFGSSYWRDTVWANDDARKFKSIEVTNPTNRDSLKGKIGARYTKVGTYNGTSIDLKITVTNWSRYGKTGLAGSAARVGNISFEHKKIAMSTQGFNWVDVTWEYVKTGTNTKVAVSGYFTFSDIDVYQGLQFSKTTSTNIRGYIIENRSNYLKYINSSDQHRFYDVRDIDIEDTKYDSRYAFTFLYSKLSSFSLRWMTDWAKTTRSGRDMTPDRYYYGDTKKYAVGEYLFFVINKPSPTTVPAPKKAVSDTTGYSMGDTLTYTITHDVPQEDPKYYHTKYIFTDTLDTVIPSPKLTVKNGAGTNVTSWFTIAVSGSKVTATAKAATLKRADFYGDTYTFSITGVPNKSTLTTKVGTGTSYIIKNKATVTTNKGSYVTNEVRTTIPKRTLTVKHVDDATGSVIKTESTVMFDGEAYSKSPLTNLKKGDVLYKPKTTAAKKGTIDGSNVTLEFRYTLPSMDISIDKISIYTDKVATGTGKGLPTIVELSQNLPKGMASDDFNNSVKLEVVDTSNANKVAFTKTYPIATIPDTLEFKLPTNYLTKGAKTNYDFRLTVPTGSTSGVVSKSPSVKTHGYTSSEKVLKNADLAERKLDYTGVILTEKEGTAAVAEFKERVTLTVPKLDRQKTGYGFNTTVDATYSNDLKELVDIAGAVKVDAKLIDSHLTYPVSSNLATVPMDRTVRKVATGSKSVTSKLELPKVYVERYTGNLYTAAEAAKYVPPVPPEPEPEPEPDMPDEDPVEGEPEYIPEPEYDPDPEETAMGRLLNGWFGMPSVSAAEVPRITYEPLDGGRKLYVPVWADLKSYDYGFVSTAPIGVNAVTYDIKEKLDVYAYMFNHSDSATTQEDELLVHPIEQEDVPLDWELGTAD